MFCAENMNELVLQSRKKVNIRIKLRGISFHGVTSSNKAGSENISARTMLWRCGIGREVR